MELPNPPDPLTGTGSVNTYIMFKKEAKNAPLSNVRRDV